MNDFFMNKHYAQSEKSTYDSNLILIHSSHSLNGFPDALHS